VLQHAADCLGNSVTQVYIDAGVENLYKNVDKLLEVGTQERVIAQADVSFSNSMIEAWWRGHYMRERFHQGLDRRLIVPRTG
jgi:hypothetical protein